MSRMSRPEFIALIAMMFATIAFSVDAMLPALPEISDELSPLDPNRATLIITVFLAGMGIGTFFVGPMSDAMGRKPVIVGGAAVYIVGAAVAGTDETLELVVAARLLQGVGAAGPRVVAMAIMRDMYTGRVMARMLSIAMSIFVIFPALAPMIGTGIIYLFDWRAIFGAFVLFSAISVTWLMIRLPESLPPESRRAMRLPLMLGAVREMVSHPMVRLSIIVQTLCLSMMFAMIASVQPVYDLIYNRNDEFPFWFAGVALVAGCASILNASLVERLGMRKLVTWTLAVEILMSIVMIVEYGLDLPESVAFGFFVFWQATVFFMVGTAMGNLNALAMEPMGHIAGMAASVIGAISTVLGSIIASPIGLMFNGSILPLALGIFVLSTLGFLLMLRMSKLERTLTAKPPVAEHAQKA